MTEGIHLDITAETTSFSLSLQWITREKSLGIFGHSGSGKTTLLEAIAGLRRDVRGLITVEGTTWLDSARGIRRSPEERGVGYVPQDALLFPHRNVMGNLMAGRRRAMRSPGRRLSIARVLAVLDLGGMEGRDVGTLSGGERQRVALGRAVCSGPDLLLMDEPLASLDLPLRRRILPYLLRVREEFEVPTIYVSHDASEIAVLSREVAVLSGGRVIARGSPEEVLTGSPSAVSSWEEGRASFLRGWVIGSGRGLTTVEIEPELRIVVAGQRAVGEVVVRLRAEDLILSTQPVEGLSAQNVLPGKVQGIKVEESAEAIEDRTLVTIAVGSGRFHLVAVITPESCRQLRIETGATVSVIFKAQACRVLG